MEYRDGESVLLEKHIINNEMKFKYDISLEHLETLNAKNLQRLGRKRRNLLILEEVTMSDQVYLLDSLNNIKQILK